MTTRAFKSISPEELEAAIASAISSITNTETKVSISGWSEVNFDPQTHIAGKEKYDLQLSIAVGTSYTVRIARGSLKDDLDPATKDDFQIPF